MVYALRQSAKNLKLNNPADAKTNNVHNLRMAHVSVFKTCVCMVVVFICCNLTLESAILMFIFGYYKTLNSNHFIVGTICIILNCGLNPYIYAIRYNDFKTQLRVMLKRQPSTAQNLESEGSRDRKNGSETTRI